ncbi:MAG: MraY family glycosyltransferase [Gemmatimonadaceae bacterium]
MIEPITALTGAAIISWLLVAHVRNYALKRQLLDVPNARSAHSVPLPRGGGLAIVAVVLFGIVVSMALGSISLRFGLAVVGGGLAVAAVGWIDDHRSVSPVIRAAVQTAAALWAVSVLGGLPRLWVGETTIQLGSFGVVVATLGIVWLTNLYNFMDGIDGLAGVNAFTVGLAATTLLAVRHNAAYAMLASIIAGASLGFLIWNWAPAQIFMGDVGSGFLGYTFGVLAIGTENSGSVPILIWLLLQGAFIVDATCTLIRRMLRRERWYAAHNSHAYQRAVRSGFTHSAISTAVAIANLVLAVLAWTVLRSAWLLWPACLFATAALGALYLDIERRFPMTTQSASPTRL